jgi:hypothetical protein
VLGSHGDTSVAVEEPVQLEEHAHRASGRRGDCGADDPELRKRPETEDEARIQNDIDSVRNPEDAHRNCGVTRATEHSVDEKQHHDHAVCTEHDGGVLAICENPWCGTHQAQQWPCIQRSPDAD